MKKWFLSLSAATMLVSGLAGCGGNANDTDEGAQQGFFRNQQNQQRNVEQQDGGGYLNKRQGMTGHYYGQNADQNFHQNRGRETERFGTRAANYGNPMTGYRTRARGMNRTQGFGRGITGNDRPGMVDNNGILNRFNANENRMGGYDNHQRYRMQGANKQQRQGMMQGSNQQQRQGMMQGQQHQRSQQGQGHQGQQGQHRGYYDGEDGHLAQRIANRVEDMDKVEDCRVIVNGDDIVIGVNTLDGDDQRVQQKIHRMTSDLDDHKDIYVSSDREQVDRIRGMDDRLRAGEPFDEVGATFNDMVQDLGRAIQRPFERSR
ncbi:YhcN/YlaJ family sporulation lipoprotein [Alteribacter populi]|uniref:YhcN/YlaJ family sporulation lipoprotein n=1 Tax=Alteribacter populi TaxID=2011011 RepID=UPI000BBB5548|nr:YhcN/YlaJ family sporulation lipoprotein [Alteribacter populi]